MVKQEISFEFCIQTGDEVIRSAECLSTILILGIMEVEVFAPG